MGNGATDIFIIRDAHGAENHSSKVWESAARFVTRNAASARVDYVDWWCKEPHPLNTIRFSFLQS
jgi:hypothetical protein